MEKTSLHRKKQLVPNAFKFLIAVGSMAGTLGIWNFLANKEILVKAQSSAIDQSSSTMKLSPLPTLVPLVNVDATAIGAAVDQTSTNQPLREVTQPSSALGSSTSLNLASNSNPEVIPAPVTTTRSSKP